MEFANANKVYRKSGGSPTIAFPIRPEIPFSRTPGPTTNVLGPEIVFLSQPDPLAEHCWNMKDSLRVHRKEEKT
jgi:hypothetical protein